MHNSLENYQGTKIEKHYFKPENVFSKETLYKAVKTIASENLLKGDIDQDTFDKAIEQLDSLMKGGEGSKGGHVIGHTSSGKPIYSNKKAHQYKDFNHRDHSDAAYLHSREASKHNGARTSFGSKTTHEEKSKHYDEYSSLSQHHTSTSWGHEDISIKQSMEGGDIIGHTKSGKAVYEKKGADHYKDFSEDDHMDAANLQYHHADTREKREGIGAKMESRSHLESHLKAAGHGDYKVKKSDSDDTDLIKAYETLGLKFESPVFLIK
jgi:hypothetical protein